MNQVHGLKSLLLLQPPPARGSVISHITGSMKGETKCQRSCAAFSHVSTAALAPPCVIESRQGRKCYCTLSKYQYQSKYRWYWIDGRAILMMTAVLWSNSQLLLECVQLLRPQCKEKQLLLSAGHCCLPVQASE